MLARSIVTAAVLALAALPSGAWAQDPVPPPAAPPATPPAQTTPAPVPVPAPATGRLSIAPERVGGRSASVLAGDHWRVRGTVKPYVAGQLVVVRFYRGSHRLLSRSVAVKPSSSAKSGTFLVAFTTSRPGRVTVRATHRATPELVTLKAAAKRVDVLPLRAKPGATGRAVRLLQQRLAALGYVVGKRGSYDDRTARAVVAFRKVAGMARTPFATEDVFRKLAHGGGRFRAKYPLHGRHVEADLSRQVLVLLDGRRVERIYPVSSGKPSTPTVLGSFRVYSKTPGTNAHGMVDSNYFIRGYAIHGYAEVPVYNASHGCLRVPIPDARTIFNWVRIGTRVDVYP